MARAPRNKKSAPAPKPKKEKETTAQKVANELNEVMGLDPPIDISLPENKLMDSIKAASEQLEEGDELSETAENFLTEQGFIGDQTEETEEETEEKPKTKGRGRPAKDKLKDKPKDKPKGESKRGKIERASTTGPGIIASILEFIKTNGPINREGILKKLTERFPDRDPDKMKKTVYAQTGGKQRPFRMEREKQVTFIVTGEGKEVEFELKEAKKK